MRVLLIAVSLPLMIAATAPAKSADKKVTIVRTICAPKGATMAMEGIADGTRGQRARPLNQMPPAKQQLAVIRTLDGCDLPTVIREDIGGK